MDDDAEYSILYDHDFSRTLREASENKVHPQQKSKLKKMIIKKILHNKHNFFYYRSQFYRPEFKGLSSYDDMGLIKRVFPACQHVDTAPLEFDHNSRYFIIR